MRSFTKDLPLSDRRNYHAYSQLDRNLRVSFPGIGTATMEVSICLSQVTIRGWVHAETSELGLKVGALLAARLGVKYVGLCGSRDNPTSFANAPFECVSSCQITDRWRGYRMEMPEEAHERVIKALRRRDVIA